MKYWYYNFKCILSPFFRRAEPPRSPFKKGGSLWRYSLNFLLIITLLNLLIVNYAFAEVEIAEFNNNTYQEILERHHKEPFILVLWSIDCPPCYEELNDLGQYSKQHKELKLVFVSTDPVSEVATVKDFIKETGVQKYEHWIYSSDQQRKLNYSIDPRWYGELPRSYFFIPCLQRQARSGKLEHKELDDFIAKSRLDNCLQ